MTAIDPIHVVGGGLAGSEAAWQVAEAGVPVVLHEMRPGGRHLRPQDRRPRRARLLELLPLRRRRAERRRPAALGDARRGRPRHRRPPTATACRPAARSPSTASPSRPRSPRRSKRTRSSRIDRAEVAGLPPAGWDSVIVATGPLTSPALAEAIRALTDESALAFFDAIAPIVHFESIDLSKAWFQSRYDKGETQAERTAYLNCPMDRAEYEALRRRAARRREDRVPRRRDRHPLLRGLPADRGDGRARPRHPALRPAEAGRPHQPARPGREALRRRPAPPRQRARHALQHRRLPDQDEARRADARCSG